MPISSPCACARTRLPVDRSVPPSLEARSLAPSSLVTVLLFPAWGTDRQRPHPYRSALMHLAIASLVSPLDKPVWLDVRFLRGWVPTLAVSSTFSFSFCTETVFFFSTLPDLPFLVHLS